MDTLGYIQAVKDRLRIESDYAVAKALDVPRQTISNYRIGRSTFDNKIAFRVAEILELDPAVVIVDMELERATRPEIRKVWKEIARRVAVVAIVTVGAAIGAPPPAFAASPTPGCVLCKTRRCRCRRSAGVFLAPLAALIGIEPPPELRV